jgi:hypothetical protein
VNAPYGVSSHFPSCGSIRCHRPPGRRQRALREAQRGHEYHPQEQLFHTDPSFLSLPRRKPMCLPCPDFGCNAKRKHQQRPKVCFVRKVCQFARKVCRFAFQRPKRHREGLLGALRTPDNMSTSEAAFFIRRPVFVQKSPFARKDGRDCQKALP